MAGKEERLNNVPDGTLLNRLFCVEAPQNSDDRRGEITCVISPRGLSVRFGKEEGMKKQIPGLSSQYGVSVMTDLFYYYQDLYVC